MSTVNNLFGGLTSTFDVLCDNSKNGLKSEGPLQNTIDELARFGEISMYDIVLPASGWTHEAVPYKCRIELADVNAYSVIGLFVSPKTTHAQRTAIDQAVITGGEQGEGYFILYCFGTAPTIDIDLKITVSNNTEISKYFDLSKAIYFNGLNEEVPLNKMIDTISNPNLLINPAFTINQSGQSSYVGSDLEELSCLDCWKIIGEATLVEKTDNGIKISNMSYTSTDLLKQSIKVTEDICNNKLTISVTVEDTVLNSALFRLTTDKGVVLAESVLNQGLNIVTTNDVVPSDCKYIDFAIVSAGINTSITINTMKVEVGDVATKYIPRPYTEEILLCRNYAGIDDVASFGFKNVVVKPSDFKSDDTISGYPYKADILCTGVTENHCATVIFNQADAQSGIFAPITNTSNKIVSIYATKVPDANITIESIVCTKIIDR